jgi:hypothetical protein
MRLQAQSRLVRVVAQGLIVGVVNHALTICLAVFLR